ncbi:unnamed protein product [Brachionus calyciflorus]|uniref:FLYWCH-type domain-containing protein n=1 Tax=Brachionus calyciflorus TaxID=104777 RepID=A0A814MEI4_9BILA|nr:unnamed protein product [Brachionus calyciflorus]
MTRDILDSSNPYHDAYDLFLNGYLFKKQRLNKNGINWLCKIKSCPGSVTLSKKDEKKVGFIDHNFDVSHKVFTELDQAGNKFKTDIKIRCESECSLSAGQNFLDEQIKIAESTGISYQDLALAIPKYSSIKPALQKRKKRGCPKLAKNLRELLIPMEYTKTANEDNHQIYNNKNKILVFWSPSQLEVYLKQLTGILMEHLGQPPGTTISFI